MERCLQRAGRVSNVSLRLNIFPFFAMKISNTIFPGQCRSVILGQKRWNFNWVLRTGQGNTFLNELKEIAKCKPFNGKKEETLKQVPSAEKPTLQPALRCRVVSRSSCPMRQRGYKFHALTLYGQGDPLLPPTH